MVAKKDTHNDCCQQHCCCRSMMKGGLKIAAVGLLVVGVGYAGWYGYNHWFNETLTVTSIMDQQINSHIELINEIKRVEKAKDKPKKELLNTIDQIINASKGIQDIQHAKLRHPHVVPVVNEFNDLIKQGVLVNHVILIVDEKGKEETDNKTSLVKNLKEIINKSMTSQWQYPITYSDIQKCLDIEVPDDFKVDVDGSMVELTDEVKKKLADKRVAYYRDWKTILNKGDELMLGGSLGYIVNECNNRGHAWTVFINSDEMKAHMTDYQKELLKSVK